MESTVSAGGIGILAKEWRSFARGLARVRAWLAAGGAPGAKEPKGGGCGAMKFFGAKKCFVGRRLYVGACFSLHLLCGPPSRFTFFPVAKSSPSQKLFHVDVMGDCKTLALPCGVFHISPDEVHKVL